MVRVAIPALDQKVLIPAGHYRHDRHYRVTQPLAMAAVAVLVALPWLNPVTLGPSAAMVQWLLSVVAGAGLLCVAAWSGFTGGAMARSAWGHGYAQEAGRAVISHAFDVLGLNRIEAEIDPRNEASARVLERLGLRREGLLRERWIVAGEVSDSALYGLLARDRRAIG